MGGSGWVGMGWGGGRGGETMETVKEERLGETKFVHPSRPVSPCLARKAVVDPVSDTSSL